MNDYCCTNGSQSYSPTSSVAQAVSYHEHKPLATNGYDGTTFTETHNENYKSVHIMAAPPTYEQEIGLVPKEGKIPYESQSVDTITQGTQTPYLSLDSVVDNYQSQSQTEKEPARPLSTRMKSVYKDTRLEEVLGASTAKEGHAIRKNENGYVTKADGCC